jgi:hypothetical protein
MMTRLDASDLAIRLGREAEAVCRHYLGAGHRQGNYWQVGDVRNTPGRSMFVRLKETVKGPAGKWTDAATGEHGDLLDVIRESCGLIDFADVVAEARTFLSLPRPEPAPATKKRPNTPAPSGSAEAARRLFAMSQPIGGTPVEAYLHPASNALILGPAEGLTPSTRKGSDYACACRRFGCACRGDCGPRPNTSGACQRGMDLRSRQELDRCPSTPPTPSPSASPPP